MRPFAPAALLAAALAVVPALAPSPIAAQANTPMTAEEFEAHTTGRTLTFHFEDQPYGVEQYLPGRRVLWAFIGDECTEGVWYPRDDMICFLYEHNPEEQCWHFFLSGNGMRGVFIGPDGPGTELYEVKNTTTPMTCLGPGVGV